MASFQLTLLKALTAMTYFGFFVNIAPRIAILSRIEMYDDDPFASVSPSLGYILETASMFVFCLYVYYEGKREVRRVAIYAILIALLEVVGDFMRAPLLVMVYSHLILCLLFTLLVLQSWVRLRKMTDDDYAMQESSSDS